MLIGVALNQWDIGGNPFFYKHALISTFWIAAGHWLKENPSAYERLLKWSLFAYPVIAAATFVKSTSLTANIAVSVVTLPLHFIYALVGTLFLLKICSLIGECKTLEYWGQNSLVVYALHFTPLLVLSQALWEWLWPENVWSFLMFFVLLYTLEYAICWLLIKLFNIKPFYYLVGKF